MGAHRAMELWTRRPTSQRLTGTQPIGVWTFHLLTVNSGATIRFSGARSAVFVSGTTVSIAGMIDGSGGCYGGDPACAGPGGGTGGGVSTATGAGSLSATNNAGGGWSAVPPIMA
jgi:hypothetical protein